MTVSPAEMVCLFTGDMYAGTWTPCYRFPLAVALCESLKPKTFHELCSMVYGSMAVEEMPVRALEALSSGFEEWDRVRRIERRAKK